MAGLSRLHGTCAAAGTVRERRYDPYLSRNTGPSPSRMRTFGVVGEASSDLACSDAASCVESLTSVALPPSRSLGLNFNWGFDKPEGFVGSPDNWMGRFSSFLWVGVPGTYLFATDADEKDARVLLNGQMVLPPRPLSRFCLSLSFAHSLERGIWHAGLLVRNVSRPIASLARRRGRRWSCP